MQRQVAFYVPRLSHLKVVAPVVDHLVRHHPGAFHVSLLFPGWKISKSGLQPTLKDFQAVFGDRVATHELTDGSAFVRLIKTGSIDAVVNLTTRVAEIDQDTLQALRRESLNRGTKWVALPYLFAQDHFIVERPRDTLDTWDLICVTGPRSIDYILSHLNGLAAGDVRELHERLAITGYPELDGITQLQDEPTIRQKYGLPVDQPIIYVSTAPSFYPLVSSSRSLRGLEMRFRGTWDFSLRGLAAYTASSRYPVLISYRRYLSSLRRFADANHACLVAKTRAKHGDPAYLKDYMDHVVDDQSFFPFTTLELMRVSSLYVGFYSASVIEAVAIGLYAMTVLFTPVEQAEPQPGSRLRSAFFHRNPGSLWNTPGVSEIMDGTKRSGVAALERFARSSLDAYVVDEQRRTQLLDRFVSYRGTSSERFVEVLASCWS